MALLKPWYDVIKLREDLREGRPMDASEFAVHLDQIRDKRAPEDYRDPARFFDRTYLTTTLAELASGVVRRLSGIKVETSPIYNLTTQFGGGKTHALSLLYHLADGGPKAADWKGVKGILEKAGVDRVPTAKTAVFVGTEFDSITGRGGDDGTPLRKTPWGEIAYQLGQDRGLALVAKHEEQGVAPSSEVIRKLLPTDKPVLILMDELMNYVSRNRANGLGGQLYNFLQNLSEEVRSHDNVVLAVSIPASELEMTAEDHADHERLKKLLERLGKALLLSAEGETSEIIRRRLFEWTTMPPEARRTAAQYGEWVRSNRKLVPSYFPVDTADDAFLASYPFHPSVLSVFERKWQALPRFQRTRGVLRLLALWVSNAAQNDYKRVLKDPLIGLGSAPLDDPTFRAAVFGQLGEEKLEGAVTTDIAGKKDAHAVRLDKEASDAMRKARLHQKVATVIFFESNGGQAKGEATAQEVKLAVAQPDTDAIDIDTALEALGESCYYLSSEKGRYRFSLQPNLNRLVADRRVGIKADKVHDRARAEVQKLLAENPKALKVSGLVRSWFPEQSGQILDRAALTLIILPPESAITDKVTLDFAEEATRNAGSSGRTFKSALIWIVPDGPALLDDEARKLLAWESILGDRHELRLLDDQQRQLNENLKKAENALRDAVWKTYKHVLLLGKDGTLKHVDLGQIHLSQADCIAAVVLGRLKDDGELTEGVSANLLVRNWSGAYQEWSTKSLRDAFFSSPALPRLLNAEVLKDTIAKGASNKNLAYVGKAPNGDYDPFHYGSAPPAADVEISEDMFVIQRDVADAYKMRKAAPPKVAEAGPEKTPPGTTGEAGGDVGTGAKVSEPERPKTAPPPKMARVSWSGEIPAQKWMNFYTKVLSRFATRPGLKLTLRVDVAPADGVSAQAAEEMKLALRELGLDDSLDD